MKKESALVTGGFTPGDHVISLKVRALVKKTIDRETGWCVQNLIYPEMASSHRRPERSKVDLNDFSLYDQPLGKNLSLDGIFNILTLTPRGRWKA